MPLYRTVSDRGIWKKNRQNEDPKPQHFHKPSYIDKEKPVVTYSQLNLGEGYRYNSKQSIPDIRQDIDEANARFDQAYSGRTSRNFKSCPSTPTRHLSRARLQETDNYLPRKESRERGTSQHRYPGPYINQPYPGNTATVYGANTESSGEAGNLYTNATGTAGQYYPDDDRYSFESRSLTAYSNYSERDSILDNSYRYPYAREPPLNLPYSVERENPFQSGKEINYEAENVVHMFLQKSFFPNVINNNFLEDQEDLKVTTEHNSQKSEEYNSTTSPSSTTDTNSSTQFEAPNATSSPRSRSNSRAAIAELKKNFLSEQSKNKPEKLEKPKVNKYLCNNNRWKKGSDTREKVHEEISAVIEFQKPISTESNLGNSIEHNQVQNKSHKNIVENKIELESSSANHRESIISSDVMTTINSTPGEEAHFMTDTVRTEQIPKVHHAEVIEVRTESSSSSSEEEEQTSQNIMVNINPLPPLTRTSLTKVSNLPTPQLPPVKLDAPPQKQNIWGPSPRHVPQLTQQPTTQDMQEEFTYSASSFPPSEQFVGTVTETESESDNQEPINIIAYKEEPRIHNIQMEMDEDMESEKSGEVNNHGIISPERSFQDTAFSNFKESSRGLNTSPTKQKKKGFFAFFRKPSKRKQPYGDDYIHIERKVETENTDDDISGDWGIAMPPDLHGDQSPRFHILQGENDDYIAPGTKPIVPMPGTISSSSRQLFQDEEIVSREGQVSTEGYTLTEEIKTSMDKATESSEQIVPSFHPHDIPVQIQAEQLNINQGQDNLPDICYGYQKQKLPSEGLEETLYEFNENRAKTQEQQLSSFIHNENRDNQTTINIQPQTEEKHDDSLSHSPFIPSVDVQESKERKLSLAKPTNLDDLAISLKPDAVQIQTTIQPSESSSLFSIQDNHQRTYFTDNKGTLENESMACLIPKTSSSSPHPPAAESEYLSVREGFHHIPVHERTQEIDIDALLNLSDTPEETEEELEAENRQQYFNSENETDFPHNMVTSVQNTKEYRKSESVVESVTEQFYQRYENEDDISDKQRRDPMNNSKVEQDGAVIKIDMETMHVDKKGEEEWSYQQSKQEESHVNIALEQSKLEEEHRFLQSQNLALQQRLIEKENERLRDQKAILDNYRSAQNSGRKVNNEVFSTEEDLQPHQSVDKKKPSSFFKFDSFKKTKSQKKEVLSDLSSYERSFTLSAYDEKESSDGVEPRTEVKMPTTPSINQIEVRAVGGKSDHTENETDYSDPISEPDTDDLATKIVREIQKSTVDLNVKSHSKSSNDNKGKKSIASGILSGGLRMSVRKTKKKELSGETSIIINEKEDCAPKDPVKQPNEDLRQRSQSVGRKEKSGGGVSDFFGIRDSRHSTRPVSETDVSTGRVMQCKNEETVNNKSTGDTYNGSLDVESAEVTKYDLRNHSLPLANKQDNSGSPFVEHLGVQSSTWNVKERQKPMAERDDPSIGDSLSNGTDRKTVSTLKNDMKIPSRKTSGGASGLSKLFSSNRKKKGKQERNLEIQKHPKHEMQEEQDGLEGVENILLQTSLQQRSLQKPPSRIDTYPEAPFGHKPMRSNAANPPRPIERPPLPPSDINSVGLPLRGQEPGSNINNLSQADMTDQSQYSSKTSFLNSHQRLSETNTYPQSSQVSSPYVTSSPIVQQNPSTYVLPTSQQKVRSITTQPFEQDSQRNHNQLASSEITTRLTSRTPEPDIGSGRQKGRQSGRFRKGNNTNSLLITADEGQTASSNLQRQASFASQATMGNDAQSIFMDSIVSTGESRPVTPEKKSQSLGKKRASVSRTESYRRARGGGGEEERPKIEVQRNRNNFNSLPRAGRKNQARQGVGQANSEDSLRNAVEREETGQKGGSRQGKRRGREGECSVM